MTQEEGKGNSLTLSPSKPDASVNQQQNKAKTDKREKPSPLTKVIIRRLPPSMNQDTFLEQIAPVPDHDFMYFVKADMNLGQYAFSRAYINFIHQEDIYLFKDKFDGYVFVDSKGNEYPAVVEFAPFQKIPKKKGKKDSKCGTIEQDPDYIKFVESWNKPEEVSLPSAEFYLEEIETREREMRANNGDLLSTTPLIEYLKQRRAEKQRIRDDKRDERRRRELEKKRLKEEDRRRRKLEKDKEREKMKDKSGKESDGDKSTTSYKSKDAPVKLLKNPEREKEKTKEGDVVEGKDRFRDNADVRHKVRVASGDKYSRGGFSHSGESELDRISQYDSKRGGKDKYKDRKERDRYNRKGPEVATHVSSRSTEFKKDGDDREGGKKVTGDSSHSFPKRASNRGGKSYERTRETMAKSRETRVTFDCSENRPSDIQKDEFPSVFAKDEPEVPEKNKCDVDYDDGKVATGETAAQEDPLRSVKKKLSGSSSREAKVDRRIRNKDRPSMEIYRPGMRRLSLQRNSPQKDSPSSSSSPSPTAQLAEKPSNADDKSPDESGPNSPSEEQKPLCSDEITSDITVEDDAALGQKELLSFQPIEAD